MKSKLKKFIKENGLTFSTGRRNSDLTVLCGYALWLETQTEYKEDAKYYLTEALKAYSLKDSFIRTEMLRVYDYASNNGYELWWNHESNRNQYKI